MMQAFPEQSRFHPEVDDPEQLPNMQDHETASLSNNQVRAAREIYERHLDMDLDLVSNTNL